MLTINGFPLWVVTRLSEGERSYYTGINGRYVWTKDISHAKFFKQKERACQVALYYELKEVVTVAHFFVDGELYIDTPR